MYNFCNGNMIFVNSLRFCKHLGRRCWGRTRLRREGLGFGAWGFELIELHIGVKDDFGESKAADLGSGLVVVHADENAERDF